MKKHATKDTIVAHRLDVKIYDYPFELDEHDKMEVHVKRAFVHIHNRPIAFAVWTVGDRDTPAEILRLGVIPELLIHNGPGQIQRLQTRLLGKGTQLFQHIVKELGAYATERVQITLPECQFQGDQYDVSAFVKSLGLEFVRRNERQFFMFGEWWDGFVFGADL